MTWQYEFKPESQSLEMTLALQHYKEYLSSQDDPVMAAPKALLINRFCGMIESQETPGLAYHGCEETFLISQLLLNSQLKFAAVKTTHLDSGERLKTQGRTLSKDEAKLLENLSSPLLFQK